MLVVPTSSSSSRLLLLLLGQPMLLCATAAAFLVSSPPFIPPHSSLHLFASLCPQRFSGKGCKRFREEEANLVLALQVRQLKAF